jgi:hypothetical protein
VGVAFVGSQDNDAYRYEKWARALGLDCDLFLIPWDTLVR